MKIFLALIFAGTLFAQVPAAQSTTSPKENIIEITAPAINQVLEAPYKFALNLAPKADKGTFHAKLNGKDITYSFRNVGYCGWEVSCGKSAQMSLSDFKDGVNILTVNVAAIKGGGYYGDQVKFHVDSGVIEDAVEHYLPAVAVQSVVFNGGSQTDVGSYSISVGPGPGYPQRSYSPANLGCPAGINSMHILVLDRQTLEPDPTIVVNPNNPGQVCLGDAASVSSFLKGLPAGDLVVAHTFLGLMSNLNMTAIGGTDFTQNTSIRPQYYNVIGVAGAGPRVAYEAFQPMFPNGPDYLPALVGSFMLDTNKQNYIFASAQHAEVSMTPNDTSAAPNTSTFTLNTSSFLGTLPGGAQGGFAVWIIDRQMGYYQDQNVFATNTGNASADTQAINNLASLISGYSPEYLIFVSSVGVPFASASSVTSNLFDAVNKLGGNGYLLYRLTTSFAKQNYLLVSSTDSAYVKAGHAYESTSVNLLQSDKTTIAPGGDAFRALLLPDNNHRFYLNRAITQAVMGSNNIEAAFEWEEVAFQQPTDWPVWTTTQTAAYNDLVNYPDVADALGCATQCQPIRSYYDGGIGAPAGSDLGVLTIPWASLQYQQNDNYSQDDFKTVVQQLFTERGQLANVYALYSLFQGLNSTENNGVPLVNELSKVANTIDSSVTQNNGNTKLLASDLSRDAAILSIYKLVPGIGPAFGAVSTVLKAASVLIPNSSGNPDNQYSVTLAELQNSSQQFGADMQRTIDILFTNFVNDPGKLQTIGGGYGAQQAPWYMCTTCVDANVPTSAVPAIALQAKRQFYEALLPTVYNMDVFRDTTAQDPTKIGGSYLPEHSTRPICITSYQDAPSQAWVVFPNPSDTSHQDIFTITATARPKPPGEPVNLSFPSTSLINDMFNAPTVDANYNLGGGAAIVVDSSFFPESRVLISRAGYTFTSEICYAN